MLGMPWTRRPWRLAAPVVVLAVLTATLSGCDDGSGPSATPSPTSSSPTDPGTGDPTATEPSTEETSPSMAPATGILLKEETSQLNAPADGPWKRMDDIVTYSSAVQRVDIGEVIALSDRESFADPASLDTQAKYFIRTIPKDAEVERLDDVLLDGEPAYLIRWIARGDGVVQYDAGTERAGRVIAVHLDLRKDDPAKAEAVTAAVLASFAWR